MNKLAFLSGLAFLLGSSHAQTFRPFLDPNCGLPGFSLKPGAAQGGDFRVMGSSDLGNEAGWEPLTEMFVGPEGVDWRDLAAHGHHRRFFRVEHLPVRPPLNPVDNFRLIDQTGKSHELHRAGDAQAFVLTFADNATLQSIWPEMRRLRDQFSGKGVRFWVINPHDDRDAIAAQARAVGIDVPVLHDRAQLAARAFQCTVQGEVVAIRGDDLTPFYRGALSEECTTTTPAISRQYLADALGQMLSNQPVTVTFARGSAAPASLRDAGSVDYAKDIAPILQSRCVTCHRAGDIGSFQMDSYATIVQKAYSIRRDVITGDMPPWHVDPASGHFSNDFSLPPEESSKLVAWIDAGTPRGTGPDPLVEHPPVAAVDWPLGEPDYKITLEEQVIPATGTVDYIYLAIQNPLPTNAWLRSVVVKPGDRSVVHHVLAFAGGFSDLLALKGGLGGYFAAFVPGMEQVNYPEGTGKLLKKGSFLLFQMHYTTNGKESRDRTEVGLYFARQQPSRELKTIAAYDTKFVIPPNAIDHEVRAESAPFPKDSYIYEVGPHMHYRGARMKFEVVLPSGAVEPLASVPAYQFDWQTVYRLSQPRLLPKGSKVRVTGGFDNSAYNPRLMPDGDFSFNQAVKFGEQSWEEMLIGYLNFAEAQ